MTRVIWDCSALPGLQNSVKSSSFTGGYSISHKGNSSMVQMELSLSNSPVTSYSLIVNRQPAGRVWKMQGRDGPGLILVM
ncbi:hypothetical protein BDV36DRAFT_277660 [Aspergillus pseudocaelatus]|uniref:Uncharacterized protein n=1 Tax=Aspergillus pseudocaelatus TaxID=1825620 RepID=A0ABQ6W030_9EURO|nr:hypothetical protein BDV36DRAFT_277660 [Aspergillus pseudocaelatus]